MKNPTRRVRTALTALGQRQKYIKRTDIIKYLCPESKQDIVQIDNALGGLRKAKKEIKMVGRGVYCYHPIKRTFTRTKMWRILRSRKKVTVEDLQELAGASQAYAKEWLGTLLKKEIVRKNKAGLYRLIDDMVTEPIDYQRVERLKAWRRQKKRLQKILD